VNQNDNGDKKKDGKHKNVFNNESETTTEFVVGEKKISK